MPTSPDRQSRPAFSLQRSYVLWCASCGTLASRSPADLLSYTREGWLECCGQVMCYFPDATAETGSGLTPQPPG